MRLASKTFAEGFMMSTSEVKSHIGTLHLWPFQCVNRRFRGANEIRQKPGSHRSDKNRRAIDQTKTRRAIDQKQIRRAIDQTKTRRAINQTKMGEP